MAQDAFSFTPFGNTSPRWLLGPAAPTSGTYGLGDVCFNDTPTPSGTFCWVCTTAGTPGTWKAVALGA